ncbi:MAG: hypothetical protein IPH31_23050 [Lewinellaceae bacterium]|nr:hypothetical protein [Lewinellaceae bacterium]
MNYMVANISPTISGQWHFIRYYVPVPSYIYKSSPGRWNANIGFKIKAIPCRGSEEKTEICAPESWQQFNISKQQPLSMEEEKAPSAPFQAGRGSFAGRANEIRTKWGAICENRTGLLNVPTEVRKAVLERKLAGPQSRWWQLRTQALARSRPTRMARQTTRGSGGSYERKPGRIVANKVADNKVAAAAAVQTQALAGSSVNKVADNKVAAAVTNAGSGIP